jgi:hypothetical protein
MGFHGYKYTIGNGWLRIEEHIGYGPSEKIKVVLEKRLSADQSQQLYRMISSDSFYQQLDVYRGSVIDGFYRHEIEIYSSGKYKKIALFDEIPKLVEDLFALINLQIKHPKLHIKFSNVNTLIPGLK